MKFSTAAGLAVVFFGHWLVSAAFGEPPLPKIEIPFAHKAPLLQASLDDPAWTAAVKIPSLSLSVKGKSPSTPQNTTVQLLWDQRFLYVRFVCEDDDIVATLSGRDAEYHKEDVVEVFLDPVGDGKEYIELQVSPNNGVRDVIYLCTAEPKYDANGMQLPEVVARDIWSFDSWTMDGLKTAANRFTSGGSAGWVAELAIPANCLHRLGQKEFKPMGLRADFIRLDYPKDPAQPLKRSFVSTNWAPVLAGCPHRSPGAYGYLNLVGSP